MRIYKLTLVVAMALASLMPLHAQMTTSPYSRYGYGLLSDNATSAQTAMGGVGYAMNSGRQINVMNPASYAFCDSLTFLFDMGVDLSWQRSSDNGNKGKSFGGGLDYITMQFPLSKRVGMSIGLLPYSSVGYSFGSEIDNGTSLRSGDGGLNQLYAGLAYRPFKGFAIGANASYMFGNLVNNLYAYSDAGTTTLFKRVMEVRDYHLQFGAQYSLNLNRRNRVTAGVTYTPSKTLLGHTWGEYYDVKQDGTAGVDTIGFTNLKNNYELAESWGAGLAWEWNQRVMVEVDFTYQPWSKVKYAALADFESIKFADRYKIAAGAQWVPSPRGSYLRRCRYRIGGYYNRDYLMVQDNNVREIGFSAGVGMPAPGSKTVINIGVEWKNRRCTPEKLVDENYINVTFGLNFNEMWFWRNKIR